MDPSGTRPLTVYSDDELLAASDSVFGLLDDPADMARSQLLATYDEIGLEIGRRGVGGETAGRPPAGTAEFPAVAKPLSGVVSHQPLAVATVEICPRSRKLRI